MTEAEWLAGEDPAAMLDYLSRWPTGDPSGGRESHPRLPSDRKLRLYVEACRLIADPLAARWANKLDTPSEVMRGAEDWCRHNVVASRPTQAERAALLRDIVGNPWRPKALADLGLSHPDDPQCVIALAQAAFEDRRLPGGRLDNARLAVLSDCLEEAGCTDADILAHLRSPGPHVRGCWAVDLVLGKE